MTTTGPVGPQHRVRAAVAPVLGEARIASMLTSQLVAGEVALELETQGDWLRVRCADAYEGWLHCGYVEPANGDEHRWQLSLGCRVRTANGAECALPLGARVSPDSAVVDGALMRADKRAMRFPLDGESVARSAAALYAGASYLWGGVTTWGCDCSGFVQRIFQLHGVILPRDAWQQAELGAAVSQPSDAKLAPADLLFFSDRTDRRVTHVGLSLGDGRMVHSALRRGGVTIEAMDGADPYVARLRAQCVAVRRLL